MVLLRVKSITSPRARFWQRTAARFGMSGSAECIAAASLIALMIIFRIANILHYRFDSDEPQHLHVIWGWAHGLVQYRDLFDNHMPLFQIALAPVVGLIGERATILYWMRFILLPMYFLAAWCTYRIGTLLFSPRVGVWSVILAGFYPGYHFTSFEFRTDNVWAPLWLLCLTVLVSGALTVPRALVAGLLLGLCFAVSMKSALFLLSIVVAAAATLFLVGRGRLGQSWAHLVKCTAAFLVTTFLVPALIMVFFALKGLWPEFRYCVFDFNVSAHAIAKGAHPARLFLLSLIAFACVIYAARELIRVAGDSALAFRRGFILIACGFYVAALYGIWVLRTREDYLPYHPLAFVFITSAVITFSMWLQTRCFVIGNLLRRVPLTALIAFTIFCVSLLTKPFWNGTAKEEENLLQNILTLTNPGDYVFDCKGETVFRRRCSHVVLESITLNGIRRRMVPENIARDCVQTHTCVAVMRGRTPLDARIFFRQNYLAVGRGSGRPNCEPDRELDRELRVAGAFLKQTQPNNSRTDFDVVIPACYEIIAQDGPVTGLLDGIRYEGARFLKPGRHSFVSTSAAQQLALIWAQAADRHFTPFTKRHGSASG